MSSFFKHLALSFCCLGIINTAIAGEDVAESSENTANFIKPYRVVFHANYDFFIPVKGTAIRQLKRQENGQWLLSSSVDSAVLTIKQTSLFDWQHQLPKPQVYQLKQTGISKNKSELLKFKWSNLQVDYQADKDTGTFDMPADTYDKLTYQLKIRQDLHNGQELGIYTIADEHKLKEYGFVLLGSEQLDTPVGKLNTIKIKRDRGPDSKRQTILWLAKDWDYLLVKIEQQEKGKKYEVVMSEGELDGQAIKGL